MNHWFKTESVRNLIPVLAVALTAAFAASPARAANITLQGLFAKDDDGQLFNFAVASDSSVDIRSYGYAGGTTATGASVPRGGFDTVLTLFSASGAFLNGNDDGPGVAPDPSTGLAADARISANLTAGSYILALTQYDNFSIGNLAAGFGEMGRPNFTADSSFASGGSCPGNMFRDISGTEGRCRNGNWAISFNNVASATPATAVPEPSALLFTYMGLGILLAMHVRRQQRRRKLPVGNAVVASRDDERVLIR